MNDNKIITNCPSCASNSISLDIKEGKLKCNHCGHIIEFKKYNKQINDINSLDGDIFHNGTKDLNVDHVNIVTLTCPTCNKMYFTGKSDKYPNCHWCGSALQVGEEYESIDNVADILPFSTTKEEAIGYIKDDLAQREFLKKDFIKKFNPNDLKGVYLPYLMLKANYKCSFSGEGEREADCESNGDNGVIYTIMSYNITRTFDIEADHIIMEDKKTTIKNKDTVIKNIISAASPYDYEERKPLEGRYLKDFVAETIDFGNVDINKGLREKLINVAKYAILKDIAYYDRGVRWDQTQIDITSIDISYVYLPLWVYIFKKREKGVEQYFYVALNARTNEVAVHLPLDNDKAMIYALKPAISLSAVAAAIIIPIMMITSYTPKVPANSTIKVYSSSGEGMGIWALLVAGAFLVGICITVRAKYKENVESSLGDHVLGENDADAKCKVKKISFVDVKTRTYRSSSQLSYFIKGMNDNGDEYRDRIYEQSHNIRTIDRKGKSKNKLAGFTFISGSDVGTADASRRMMAQSRRNLFKK